MPIMAGAATLAALAWVYLLAAHGGFWRTDQRLPRGPGPTAPAGAAPAALAPAVPAPAPPASVAPGRGAAGGWPGVVAVIPARDEAAVLPATLPTLLGQDYPGEFSVVLVDDASTDGTGATAAALGAAAPRALRVVTTSGLPEGWAGKVNAMAAGVAAAGECDYLLFTDADISYAPGMLADLVRAALADDRALVSQMALLRAETGWERLIVPAFVYFFAQLYPFRRVNRPGVRTAAAAGGCMLVRREVLAAAGGLARIRGARIDDVALGRLLKRPPSAARCWLGFTTRVRSERPYPRLAGLWDMIARSAYTQLRYSPVLLVATLAGLLWLYALPPAAMVAGAVVAGLGGGTAATWCAAAGAAGWLAMALSFQPVLRLYRLGGWRGPLLPLVAMLYALMTADSARRHYAGRGGEWKGRTIAAPAGRAD
jgi:hopene-associated glycosyltransferase HpnB